MKISPLESIIIIAICTAATFGVRALPFLIFGSRPVPKTVRYLGKILPMAVIATLVVYCLKGMSFASLGGFLPEIIAVLAVSILHLKFKNTFISIVSGTVIYMILIQLIFI